MPVSSSSRTSKQGQTLKESRKCKYCCYIANIKGIASHERSCKKKQEDIQKMVVFLAKQCMEIQGMH